MVSQNKKYSPVIVLGARSGTSAVARVLQENLGICMDEGPIRKDWRNPKGYYEDHKLMQINRIANNYKAKFIGTGCNAVPAEWVSAFVNFCAVREWKYNGTWGFKDPTSISLIQSMKQFFSHPKWIVCVRPYDDIIKSYVNKLNMKKQIATTILMSLNSIIKREIGNKGSYINMSYHRSDKDLKNVLKKVLNAC